MVAPPDDHDTPIADPHRRPPIEEGRARSEERKTSTPAIVALVLVLVGLCLWPLGFIGGILGIVGLNDIRKSDGRLSGGALAWMAIVIGGLETLGCLIAGVMLALGAVAGAKGLAGPLRATTAATMLEQVAAGQRSMQAAAHLDADGDGIGEYGELTDVDAFTGASNAVLTEQGAVEIFGYRARVSLPDTTDGREEQWWGVMEPAVADQNLPWLYMDESSVLRFAMSVAGPPTREEAMEWEITTSQGLAQSLVQEAFE